MHVLIFANGDLDELDWIRPFLDDAEAIIAADGGCHHLFALERPPDLMIGDLDSVTPQLLDWLAAAGSQVVRYPTAKDETDLELAMLYAISHYPEAKILIFGALGGRLDQTLANILLLAHPAVTGRHVALIQQHQRAWLIDGNGTIHGRPGDLISLVPLGGPAQIQLTEGLQWALINETLEFGPARGISNVMTASEASVMVGDGQLLCIHTARAWSR